MKLWLGNRWMSIEEARAALDLTQVEVLTLAGAGRLTVHYETVVYQRVPRRSRREPFFLLADVERIQAQRRQEAFTAAPTANA